MEVVPFKMILFTKNYITKKKKIKAIPKMSDYCPVL